MNKQLVEIVLFMVSFIKQYKKENNWCWQTNFIKGWVTLITLYRVYTLSYHSLEANIS